jgi:hypothetical protein
MGESTLRNINEALPVSMATTIVQVTTGRGNNNVTQYE